MQKNKIVIPEVKLENNRLYVDGELVDLNDSCSRIEYISVGNTGANVHIEIKLSIKSFNIDTIKGNQ